MLTVLFLLQHRDAFVVRRQGHGKKGQENIYWSLVYLSQVSQVNKTTLAKSTCVKTNSRKLGPRLLESKRNLSQVNLC